MAFNLPKVPGKYKWPPTTNTATARLLLKWHEGGMILNRCVHHLCIHWPWISFSQMWPWARGIQTIGGHHREWHLTQVRRHAPFIPLLKSPTLVDYYLSVLRHVTDRHMLGYIRKCGDIFMIYSSIRVQSHSGFYLLTVKFCSTDFGQSQSKEASWWQGITSRLVIKAWVISLCFF